MHDRTWAGGGQILPSPSSSPSLPGGGPQQIRFCIEIKNIVFLFKGVLPETMTAGPSILTHPDFRDCFKLPDGDSSNSTLVTFHFLY